MKHPPYLRLNLGPAASFSILAAMSLLFWWRPLANTLGLALANEAYTHILLILPLSAALIYLNLNHVNSKVPRTDAQPSLCPGAPLPGAPLLGSALLAVALLIGCYTRWGTNAAPADVRLSLAMFALVIWWIASVVCSFGLHTFRSLLFPLCFLFFLVPVPSLALSVIVDWLQHGSAWMAATLFRAFGEPVQRDGILLSLPKLDIEVTRECSSIRSSFLLVITTIVLAHLFLRSWWRNLLLVLIAIPLSIVKNGLRIFVIAELGTHVDPGFLDGRLHHQGGIVFLVIALAAIVALLAILHRDEMRLELLSAPPRQA
jgi:exosortase